MNVLVCVRRFPVNVKVEGTVGFLDDGDIKHGNASVFLHFFRPPDVRVDGVEMVVQALDVVVVDGHERIVGFSEPEENDFTGVDVVVTSGIAGKGCCLKIFHVNVRERAAGGFSHAEPFDLLEKAFAPSEVGNMYI